MLLDPITIQIISNIIVLIGVIVAVVTLIYNVRTAKKTQTAVFLFESRKDKDYVESLHILKKAHQSGKSMSSRFLALLLPIKNWMNVANSSTYLTFTSASQSVSGRVFTTKK